MINIGRRLLKAAGHSLSGLADTFRHEFAFRVELALSVVLLPAAFFLGHTKLERALLIASWMLVLIVELINSAIERAVDRVSEELHELSRQAKDIASSAVFMTCIMMVLVWFFILMP